MSPKIKLTAYAVLLILAAWFFWGFYSNYSAATKAAAPTDDGAGSPASTNAAAAPQTNPHPAPANATVSAPAQNPAPSPPKGAASAAMIGYLAAFVAVVIGLGLLMASDVTYYLGSKAVDYLFNDVGEALRDPEYERAEAEWTNGKYLDAIQMMRDYLQKNPRQLHAALRIAEIYEKDLKNYLAATLEYEEVLKHKLPAERWGWAAIHLCNLYSRRHQPDKAVGLLRRIVEEYPKTGAAKKARARLGIAEPEPEVTETEAAAEPDSPEETPVISIEAPPPPSPLTPTPLPPPPEPPKSNLPPGFRPKG
jgi:TolA-binding protein